MWFTCLRENSDDDGPAEQSTTNRIIYIVYNAVYWVPIVLPILGIIDYRAGFITFAIIIFVRLCANLYRVNALTLEQAEVFPLRSP